MLLVVVDRYASHLPAGIFDPDEETAMTANGCADTDIGRRPAANNPGFAVMVNAWRFCICAQIITRFGEKSSRRLHARLDGGGNMTY
jgi:hypothetical protein